VTFGVVALVVVTAAPAFPQGYLYKKGTFVMGGGMNSPVGETNPYLNSSGTIYFGGGRNFGRTWGLEVEYTHNWLAVDPAVLTRASTESTQVQNAHASLWSLTLNGIYRFGQTSEIVPWVTAGGGYYKRNIQLTQNALVYIPPIWDPWWGWIDGGWTTGESILGERTASAFGINVGGGFDFGIEGNAKLFIEARYHYVPMDGVNMQIIPVMAGVRW
jgi:opacity protein-like surface antigen